jgi:RimJ/RimL family protein N-acetyltransferase
VSFENLSTRLEGRLVVLEPLTAEHEAGLGRAAADDEVWRWMPRVISGPEDFHGWMADALAEAAAGVSAPYAILSRASGEPVGSSRYLTLRPEHRGLEIGYTWHAPSVWGTGVNVEAKLLLLEHAFERLGCIRVEFKTDARNERSRAALLALPARFEGIFRKHMVVRDGELRDSAYYAITDDEWPSVKSELTRRLEAKVQAE